MARTPRNAYVSDDDEAIDHGHQPEVIQSVETEPEMPRSRNTKSRRSILEETAETTFWKINSLDETESWTDKQKADAIDQARRLATHYLELFEKHTDMQAQIAELNSRIESLDVDVAELRQDNNDQENELAKKQGAIEYLERQQSQPRTTLSPDAPHASKAKVKALADPQQYIGFKSTFPFDQWKLKVEEKLSTDSHLFDTEQRRI
jgi:hypothetical protein